LQTSIHENGFLYGDLKPENVVITETGHIKLTDFGGCRPVTEAAKALVKSVARHALKNMRDGDWKEYPPPSDKTDSSSNGDGEMGEDDDFEEDVRIEGTTSYLPPEVVLGAFPTMAADSWALGCVLYQCLSGRPPLLEADEVATKNRIVSFDVSIDPSTAGVDPLFDDKHAAAIPDEARDLITQLLDRDPSKRPGTNEVAEHAFFTSNVFALYSQPAYPLDVGTVAPTPNAQWARRQFSSIWAPQPAAYNIALPTGTTARNETSVPVENGPIQEGEEASGFFTPSGKLVAPASGKFAKLQ
jgi:serine/threonine protein kinase